METVVDRVLQFARALAPAALLGMLGAAVSAQVPPGWMVAAFPAYRAASCCAGLGHLSVIDPTRGTTLPIQGLSASLIGLRIPAIVGLGTGVTGVLLRESDQAVVCGKSVDPGQTLELHVLHLNGLSVANEQVFSLGITMPLGGRVIPRFELAPGVILVSMMPLDTSTLVPAPHAIVDLATGQVQLVPFPLYAVGAAPHGDEFFVAMAPLSTTQVDIYAIPRRGGGTRFVRRTNRFSDLLAHPNGLLYVTEFRTVLEIDPDNGASRPLGAFSLVPTDLALEPATGDLLVTMQPFRTTSGSVERLSPSGAQSTIAPVNGLGLAVHANPRPYGIETPAAHRYRWTPWQPPVGLPRLRSTHALQVTATPVGSAGGVVLFSTTPGRALFGGIQLHLSPTGLAVLATMPASGRLPLPIPNRSALAGMTVYFQTLHLDAGGLAASDGLAVTIMP